MAGVCPVQRSAKTNTSPQGSIHASVIGGRKYTSAFGLKHLAHRQRTSARLLLQAELPQCGLVATYILFVKHPLNVSLLDQPRLAFSNLTVLAFKSNDITLSQVADASPAMHSMSYEAVSICTLKVVTDAWRQTSRADSTQDTWLGGRAGTSS